MLMPRPWLFAIMPCGVGGLGVFLSVCSWSFPPCFCFDYDLRGHMRTIGCLSVDEAPNWRAASGKCHPIAAPATSCTYIRYKDACQQDHSNFQKIRKGSKCSSWLAAAAAGCILCQGRHRPSIAPSRMHSDRTPLLLGVRSVGFVVYIVTQHDDGHWNGASMLRM